VDHKYDKCSEFKIIYSQIKFDESASEVSKYYFNQSIVYSVAKQLIQITNQMFHIVKRRSQGL